MKKLALLTGLCAITTGAFAQSSSVIIIPAFQNRFASIHQPVVALNNVNSTIPTSSALETRSSAGSSTQVGARGVVISPSASTRVALDPTTMNIPVFPGNTAILQQQAAGFSQFPFVVFPNAGFGNTGVFMQQGAGSSLQEVDRNRTTATPGPAVDAVPNPAVNAVPNSAAPVATTPAVQAPAGTILPVQQQPVTVVPGTPTAVPGGTAVPNSAAPTPVQPAPSAPNR